MNINFFLKNKNASILIIFALLSFPLFFLGGIILNYNKKVNIEYDDQSFLDSAVLYAVRYTDTNEAYNALNKYVQQESSANRQFEFVVQKEDGEVHVKGRLRNKINTIKLGMVDKNAMYSVVKSNASAEMLPSDILVRLNAVGCQAQDFQIYEKLLDGTEQLLLSFNWNPICTTQIVNSSSTTSGGGGGPSCGITGSTTTTSSSSSAGSSATINGSVSGGICYQSSASGSGSSSGGSSSSTTSTGSSGALTSSGSTGGSTSASSTGSYTGSSSGGNYTGSTDSNNNTIEIFEVNYSIKNYSDNRTYQNKFAVGSREEVKIFNIYNYLKLDNYKDIYIHSNKINSNKENSIFSINQYKNIFNTDTIGCNEERKNVDIEIDNITELKLTTDCKYSKYTKNARLRL
jgi:hypothetical protein